jgi:hypothetical protein
MCAAIRVLAASELLKKTSSSHKLDSEPSEWSSCYSAGDSTVTWIRKISKDLLTPARILKRLSKSTDADVRMAVADHRNTSLEVLSTLSRDENPDVRFAIAENHNINLDVLKRLAKDENPFVAHRALKTLERIECCTPISA